MPPQQMEAQRNLSSYCKRKHSDPKEPQLDEISEMFPALTYDEVAPLRSTTLDLPFSAPGEDDFDIEIIVDYRSAGIFSNGMSHSDLFQGRQRWTSALATTPRFRFRFKDTVAEECRS
jgi:hypothetical protein